MSKHIPILMYHNVVETIQPEAPDWIYVNSFKAQMEYVLKEGFTPITPDLLLTKNALPKKPILITFDDGYEGVYQLAFPILKALNIKFTVFIISSFISDETNKKTNSWNFGWRPETYHLSKKMITEMLESGLLTLGSHTHSHQMFKDITEQEIEQEISSSLQFLKQEFNQKITSISYPGGYLGNEKTTYETLKNLHIKLAFGGQIDKIENLDKINYFNIYRINITNDINFTSEKVKFRFEALLNPFLNTLSNYNSLNFLLKFLLPQNK